MELTKKEKDFLINWLSDDLDIAQKNYHNSSKTIIKMLLSIIKKLMENKK
tara:strand:+ start:278 stop:427 length:150 start_codon:yes stop_codon:yes gene_type:complete